MKTFDCTCKNYTINDSENILIQNVNGEETYHIKTQTGGSTFILMGINNCPFCGKKLKQEDILTITYDDILSNSILIMC